MLGYYLGLAVLFIGTPVSALAYRAKPSGPRLAGMIGFAVAALARLAYILLVLNLAPLPAVRTLYTILTTAGAIGLACVVYAYWQLAAARA